MNDTGSVSLPAACRQVMSVPTHVKKVLVQDGDNPVFGNVEATIFKDGI